MEQSELAPGTNPPPFIVKAYDLHIVGVEPYLDPALGFTPTITLFDNKARETKDRPHAILYFFDDPKHLKEPGNRPPNVFQIYYLTTKFPLVTLLLHQHLASDRVECYLRSVHGRPTGGVRFKS